MKILFAALIALLLLTVSAAAQGCGQGNPNCVAPTPPPGDNSNRIATTAWVTGGFPQGPGSTTVNDLVVWGNSTGNQLKGSSNPTAYPLNINLHGTGTAFYPDGEAILGFQMIDGSSGSGQTSNNPSFGISRQEAMTGHGEGGQNAALFISSIGRNTSSSGVNAQTNGITVKVDQLATFSGDTAAGYFVAHSHSNQTSGNNHAAFGVFALALNDITNVNAIAVNPVIGNNSGVDHNNNLTGAYSIGVYIQSNGANKQSLAIEVQNSGTAPNGFDSGIKFELNSVATTVLDIRSSATNLLATAGAVSYTLGIDLNSATFSTAAFRSPGFLVDGAGNTTYKTAIATAAAPTVSAGQIGYGGTTTANTNCGTLAGSAGCIVVNVAGTQRYVPYY